ncbi:rhamnulokinase family protein [Actinomadura miaoliensis]|uniref:Rhamnulokinase family protein n=1 Tax=Actinomadura miaoliensis TaxID=430685 RepID=A0ABP7X4V8_9ACTN
MSGRSRAVVAADLGAESGRVVLGRFDGSRVELTEVHRFPNGPRHADGLLRWDLEHLWSQVRMGLAKAGALAGRVDSVGVDTWGLDYGLLDADGEPLADPVSYRDPRTRGVLADAVRRVGAERLYADTGTQLMEINAVYQLMADADAGVLEDATTLLMMADLFHHRLSGATVAEYTAVSTTGAYDMTRRAWATGLLDDLGVPTHMLPEVVDAGTALGPVLPAALDHPAYADATVIVPGAHDTASAVVSVPFVHPDAGYVSSGTWSLVGVETGEAVVTEAARKANLTNEGGVRGTIRLLRNCMGLWLLQECRRQWAREGHRYSYDDLVRLAEAAPAAVSVVNPDHPGFVQPGDMPARIRDYCRRTGQPVPAGPDEVVRCVLDSLALGYRAAFDDIAEVTGRPLPAVHIVGGGSRNALLNRLTAEVTGLPVVTGPVEATALGNVLAQLMALGELSGLDEARAAVRAGTRTGTVEPSGADRWSDLYGRLRAFAAADQEAALADERRS